MTTENKLDPRPGLYRVTRTSGFSYDSEKPPVEGAFFAKYEPFRNGAISGAWFIEVPDLVEFVDKHGTIVLSREYSGHMEIEIYDDYRE